MKRSELIVTGMVLAGVQIGAMLAFLPRFFSWSAVFVMLFSYWIIGGLGICLSFHRILTHRSMKLPRLLEYTFATFGTLALQGGPIEWVATHRAHHSHSDKAGDPHNIFEGLWWAHYSWMHTHNPDRPSGDRQVRLAHDIAADPYYRFLEKTMVLWQFALAALLFKLGGWSWVIWGVFVRLTVTYHFTWLVNSASHAFGYQTYKTTDQSRNNWVVAILAWGEGWHNNHHAFPASARHGLAWWEFDMTWMVVSFLQKVGLAKDVRLPTAAMLERQRLPRKGRAVNVIAKSAPSTATAAQAGS